MTPRQLWGDTRGGVLVEAAVTMSLLLALTFGVIQVGYLMWIQSALQHGVEMAARCASASDAAIAAQNGAVITACYTNSNTPGASNNQTGVEQYASQQSYGLNPPTSTFTHPAPAGPTWCDVNDVVSGNQVSASYTFSFMTSYFFKQASLTLTAQSCYPG